MKNSQLFQTHFEKNVFVLKDVDYSKMIYNLKIQDGGNYEANNLLKICK